MSMHGGVGAYITTAYQEGALGPDVAQHLPYGRMTQAYRDGIFAVQPVGAAEGGCLGAEHAILAVACAADPSAAPCAPLTGADKVRALWKTPLCPEIKSSILELGCPEGQDLADSRAAIKSCLDDPGSSPTCAFMAHPDVLDSVSKQCPDAYGDLAPAKGISRTWIIGGAVAAAAIIGVVLIRKR